MNSRNKPILILIIMLLCLSSCDKSTGPDGSGHHKIAYVSYTDDDLDIYTVNTDGSNPTLLTDSLAHEYYPFWSPDGQYIYYQSLNEDVNEIYRMDADGSNKTKLNEFGGTLALVDISADGSKLLFWHDTNFQYDIYIMSLWPPGTTHVKTISTSYLECVRFTPDGQNIMYMMASSTNYLTYMVSIDGSTTVPIADDVDDCFDASVSPDGTRIACVFQDSENGPGEIIVCDIDESNRVNFSSSDAASRSPRWSPDGTQLLYMEIYSPSITGLMIINADGTGRTLLTDSTSYLYKAQWSPDGSKICYLDNRDGDWEVYIMNSDGSGKTKLTDNYIDDSTPTCSPAL